MSARALETEVTGSINELYRRWGKRIFDLATATIGLVLLSPLLSLCGLVIRITSRGPVFFRQTRIGRQGHEFKLFKFRTMHSWAEQLSPAVVVPGDQRLTLIGGLLRRTKLDELPQLINVLRGDMSLVGPRPRVPEEIDLASPQERALLTLRPGMTSYASIYHRMEAEYCAGEEDPKAAHRETILPQKSYLDKAYVESVSFLLDLKLIFLTVLLVFMPGRAQPRAVRFFGLEVRPYSRAGQMLLEAVTFVASVRLAYWLRYEGDIPEFNRFQMAAFMALIPAARLAANRIFGVYNTIWRYINLVDVALLVMSLSVVSVLLLLLRLFLPAGIVETHIFQLPLSVIVLEYFLVAGGCIGLRGLRRLLYEMNHRYQPLPTDERRRIVIVGAGLSGLGIALEIGRYPHLELVGFVDDDAAKQGRLIAGYSVLGPSRSVSDLMRQHEISDLIVCADSISPRDLDRIYEHCRVLGVKSHVIPTIDQILRSDVVEAGTAPRSPQARIHRGASSGM